MSAKWMLLVWQANCARDVEDGFTVEDMRPHRKNVEETEEEQGLFLVLSLPCVHIFF